MIPKFLFLELNTECNLRCKHCHIWQNKDSEFRLSAEEKIRVVREFFDITRGTGEVVFGGGEPFQTSSDFFALQKEFAQLGMKYSFVTNGTLFDESTYSEIFSYPPTSISLSLDSHLPEVHDWLRGVPGTFAKVTKNIRGLAEFNQRAGKKVPVYVHSVFHNKLLDGVTELINFVKELGADGVHIQPLMPTFFHQGGKPDWFFENHRPREPEKIKNAVDELLKLREEGFVKSSILDINYLGKFIADSGTALDAAVCGSEAKNLMIDPGGNLQLCFFMDKLAPRNPNWNVRKISLKEFLVAEELSRIRVEMKRCRRGCGLQTCHRKDELDLNWQNA